MDRLFEISDLKCSYDKFSGGKTVLEISRLVIPKGRKVFIVGESGIGKSTILEVLGLMNNTVVPDPGTRFLFYEGEDAVDLLDLWKRNDDNELSAFRRKHFNFIFQSTNLMRNFTAYENISITRMLQGYDKASSFARAAKVLGDLGLGHIDENRMAQELSGGQQQRLAFARAVIPDFSVLFGDEPTGNLDSDNAVRAMKLLSDKLEELKGSSAIIVTHDMHLATAFADTVIKIRKEARAGEHDREDISFYGKIDQDSVFEASPDRKVWSNGKTEYASADFEVFLKHVENE